jgi:hypothetical protein
MGHDAGIGRTQNTGKQLATHPPLEAHYVLQSAIGDGLGKLGSQRPAAGHYDAQVWHLIAENGGCFDDAVLPVAVFDCAGGSAASPPARRRAPVLNLCSAISTALRPLPGPYTLAPTVMPGRNPS